MNLKSEVLRAQQERIRAEDPNRSGSPESLILTAPDLRALRTIDLARVLVRHGMRPARAHQVISQLAEKHEIAVIIPNISDIEQFRRDCRAAGTEIEQRQPPTIDIATLRTQKLNLTQEEFSVMFGLPLGTLKNWEQGRSTPDPFSRCFLAVIERDPELAQSVVRAR